MDAAKKPERCHRCGLPIKPGNGASLEFNNRTPFVRWEASPREPPLTYPDVLRRLGLTNGQRVDEATGWAVIQANHDHLVKLTADAPS